MNLLENLFLRCYQEPLQEEKEYDFINSLQKYILNNLDQPLSIQTLAAFTALSPSHFAHRFTKNFGISPRAYVEIARLEKAKRLLASKECQTVKAAAYAVGFMDPLNFSRRFHTHYGFAPTALIDR